MFGMTTSQEIKYNHGAYLGFKRQHLILIAESNYDKYCNILKL